MMNCFLKKVFTWNNRINLCVNKQTLAGENIVGKKIKNEWTINRKSSCNGTSNFSLLLTIPCPLCNVHHISIINSSICGNCFCTSQTLTSSSLLLPLLRLCLINQCPVFLSTGVLFVQSAQIIALTTLNLLFLLAKSLAIFIFYFSILIIY